MHGQTRCSRTSFLLCGCFFSVGLVLIAAPSFAQDGDGHGLLNSPEAGVHGTNPVLWDTEGDGVEVEAGSDPNVPASTPLAVPLSSPLGVLVTVLAIGVCGAIAAADMLRSPDA